MERGDIAEYSILGQSCIWEGVLATPPEGITAKTKYKFYERANNWETAIPMWKPNDLAVRSLADCVNRLGIGTDVITFLHPDAVDPIYEWLLRKGVRTTVLWYDSPKDYEIDLRYNRGIQTVYVSTDEEAFTIGFRAHVVKPNTAWRI